MASASAPASTGPAAGVNRACAGVSRACAVSDRACKQGAVIPERLAIGAPEQGDLPPRQRFARVPLALAVVEKAARRETIEQAPRKLLGTRPLDPLRPRP